MSENDPNDHKPSLASKSPSGSEPEALSTEPEASTTKPAPENTPSRIAPAPRLSRGGLVIGFVAVILMGLLAYSFYPDAVGGPELPVTVEVTTKVMPSKSKAMIPAKVVSLTNESKDPLRHLAVILNGHYQIMQDSPLAPGETLDLPLAIFTDKRSSRRFDAKHYPVQKIVVRGQLPAGTRGVSVFRYSDESSVAETSADNSTDQ